MPTEAPDEAVPKPTPHGRRTPRPAGLEPLAAGLLDLLDDHLADVRDKLDSLGNRIVRVAYMATGMVFILMVLLIVIVAQTRGVDVADTADATVKVVKTAIPTDAATEADERADTEPPAPEESPDG